MINNQLSKLNKLVNTYYNSILSPVVPETHFTHILKGDSGTTNHYISPNAKDILKNIHKNDKINVTLPDSSTINSTHTGQLHLPELSNSAKTAHILPALQDTSLLSLGQLANDGCQILLDKKTLKVFKNFHLILEGFRNKSDGLWDIPFPINTTTNNYTTTDKLNFMTNKSQPIKSLIQYLHAALFSPPKSA